MAAGDGASGGLLSINQLPPSLVELTGRAGELDELERVARAHSDPVVAAVMVISGLAGVGKTALAIEAGHRLARDFPDGRLFVDLRGRDREPLRPYTALDQLLATSGITTGEIRDDPNEPVVRWRSMLRSRRLLIILDDAENEDQVRPLLPPPKLGATSAVIVTSRHRLAGLAAAYRASLPVLAPADALAALAGLVGDGRIEADPANARRIVELCDRLPLALTVVASRLAVRPRRSLATVAARLDDERRRLGELRAGDVDVRASFEVTYRRLSSVSARMFRGLSLATGLELAAAEAATVAGLDDSQAAMALDELVDSGLLSAVNGRYRLLNLIRVFAAEMAAEVVR